MKDGMRLWTAKSRRHFKFSTLVDQFSEIEHHIAQPDQEYNEMQQILLFEFRFQTSLDEQKEKGCKDEIS